MIENEIITSNFIYRCGIILILAPLIIIYYGRTSSILHFIFYLTAVCMNAFIYKRNDSTETEGRRS